MCFDKEHKDLICYKKDKVWFLRQLRNKDMELGKLQELVSAKAWLSSQYDSLTKRIHELELWIQELEMGKEWLNQQNLTLNSQIKDLEAWIQVLENEKSSGKWRKRN